MAKMTTGVLFVGSWVRLIITCCTICILVPAVGGVGRGGGGRGEASVVLGNQLLRDGGYMQLQGRSVAILSNPTGVFMDTFEHIVDDALSKGR